MGLCQTSWHAYNLLPTLNKAIPGHASRRAPTLRHPQPHTHVETAAWGGLCHPCWILEGGCCNLQRTACCWQTLSFAINQQCCQSQVAVL